MYTVVQISLYEVTSCLIKCFTLLYYVLLSPPTAGVDFVSLNETIVFEPSEQRRRLALIAINDESVEDTELFSVNVTSNMPRVFARHLSTQGLRILDNDSKTTHNTFFCSCVYGKLVSFKFPLVTAVEPL